METLTLSGSSNLNLSFSGAQQKFCVKKMKGKCVTFCFTKFDTQVSPKSWGEG